MDNYSSIFTQVLAEFESPYVPGDRGDEGKGQVTARAGYQIHTTLDAHIGYIGKNPGQTQYHGIAVDALKDNRDGTGADFLTDELQPDGRRLIKVAYTAYAPPPPGPDVSADWVQPTSAMLDYGGPLVLKQTTPPPQPEPAPPPDDVTARFDAIDQQLARLEDQHARDTAEILAHDDANTEKIQQQIHDLVEDAEATLILIGKVLLLFWRDRPPRMKSAQQAVDELDAWIVTKTRVIAADE